VGKGRKVKKLEFEPEKGEGEKKAANFLGLSGDGDWRKVTRYTMRRERGKNI